MSNKSNPNQAPNCMGQKQRSTKSSEFYRSLPIDKFIIL